MLYIYKGVIQKVETLKIHPVKTGWKTITIEMV